MPVFLARLIGVGGLREIALEFAAGGSEMNLVTFERRHPVIRVRRVQRANHINPAHDAAPVEFRRAQRIENPDICMWLKTRNKGVR